MKARWNKFVSILERETHLPQFPQNPITKSLENEINFYPKNQQIMNKKGIEKDMIVLTGLNL
jgi:hypothetical protein